MSTHLTGACVPMPYSQHCKEGISRSTTLTIAFLMARMGRSLDEALAQVHAARDVAKPNKGFLEQLRQYEASLPKGGTAASGPVLSQRGVPVA